jgi:hypothetical protein
LASVESTLAVTLSVIHVPGSLSSAEPQETIMEMANIARARYVKLRNVFIGHIELSAAKVRNQ